MPTPIPDTSSWLVATKLHPPLLRDDTIRRPRLEEALKRSVSALPLTLLSAPAGYGKTTMLAALPHLLPDFPLAWVTLDAEDNDPIRFVSLLATALQRLNPECGRSVWPWLSGGIAEGSELKRAVGALINDVLQHLSSPFVLVLDDLHFVTEPAVYVALEYLLDHQPPQLHVAIGTRHDPPLRLARMAARRQLAEVRRADLGFSQSEANQLLNETLDLSLSPEEVVALQERTEGWPAGLCLLAGPLGRMGTPSDRSQFMAAMAHSERYALEFLAEEVLRYLPDDLRRFLMQTSILAEMTPSVCRAVTGREDASEVLEGLYRQNLTIASITSEVEGGEPIYRHHALFARLLTQQLEREMPEEIAELHRLAAQAQTTPGRAIAHYLAAGLWTEAARLIIKSGMQLLYTGMAETVRAWYKALPAETVAENPGLTVLMGRCEIHRGDYAASAVFLNRAREASIAAGDVVGEAEALTSLITLTYQNDNRAAATALVERALQLPLKPWGLVAARLADAWVHLADCDWATIKADISEALEIPNATRIPACDLIGVTYMSAPLAACPGCLEVVEHYAIEAAARALPETAWRLGADEIRAWVLMWKGRAKEALAQSEAAEALRQQLGGYPFVGNDAAALLAVLHTLLGNPEAAGQAVDRLVQRIGKSPDGKSNFYFHAAGRSLAMLGRYSEARAMHERLTALPTGIPLTRYLADHLEGLLDLVQGQFSRAASVLERAAEQEDQLAIAWVGGSARLLQAHLHLEEGRVDSALAIVEKLVGEWEKAGRPGCAALDGPLGMRVLRVAAQHGDSGARRILDLFTESVVSGAPSGAVDSPAQPVTSIKSTSLAALADALTQRERDVLRLIVAGHTNRQIGEELFITAETVKSHVVHILRKLDVSSRTQAAIRGRELGL